MQLNTLLLAVVGILTVLSGVSVYVGSKRAERSTSVFFFLATICATLWGISIAVFQSLTPQQESLARIAVFGIYCPALFMDVFMLAYVNWQFRPLRWLNLVSSAAAILLCGALLYDPSLLYSSLTLSNVGNSITITNDWFYWVYLSFFVVMTGIVLGFVLYRIMHTRSKGQRMGMFVILVGMGLMGILSLIFNVILPFGVRYDLIWVGPAATGAFMLSYYYAVLKYRLVQLNTSWLKFLSYAILVCSASIIYMVIFYIVFTALFKVPNPSASIFVLNFIMITIVLLLFPVLNELSAFIRSLIHTNQVDLPYIVKKLNNMTTNVNLNELSEFLADHMHFAYIGMVVNGKLYGSHALPITASELKQITLLKSGQKGGIWQELNEPVAEIFNRTDIKAVAELRDAKGKPFGQIIVGKPLGKMGFERRDLIQLEMIVNLVAAMIDTKAK